MVVGFVTKGLVWARGGVVPVVMRVGCWGLRDCSNGGGGLRA